jgi:hypothetical protein
MISTDGVALSSLLPPTGGSTPLEAACIYGKRTANRFEDICQGMRVLYAVPILRDLLNFLSVSAF